MRFARFNGSCGAAYESAFASSKSRTTGAPRGRPSQFHEKSAPQESAKTAHVCPMKITEDVRQYATGQGIAAEEALKKFVENGAEVYAKV